MRQKREYRQASKENYTKFCSKHPEIKLDFVQWQNIIYTFNYLMRDYILESGEKVKFPWGFGEFAISKKKPKTKVIDKEGREHINLPINWQKTRELKKRIYHFNFDTEGFRFKWMWFNKSGKFFLHQIWVFKPSRITSRLLKHYLTKKGQHYKYHEWGSVYLNQ